MVKVVKSGGGEGNDFGQDIYPSFWPDYLPFGIPAKINSHKSPQPDATYIGAATKISPPISTQYERIEPIAWKSQFWKQELHYRLKVNSL